MVTPNLPTKILPTKIRWLKISGRFPTDMIIPPLKLKILLESNALKSNLSTEIDRIIFMCIIIVIIIIIISSSSSSSSSSIVIIIIIIIGASGAH